MFHMTHGSTPPASEAPVVHMTLAMTREIPVPSYAGIDQNMFNSKTINDRIMIRAQNHVTSMYLYIITCLASFRITQSTLFHVVQDF